MTLAYGSPARFPRSGQHRRHFHVPTVLARRPDFAR